MKRRSILSLLLVGAIVLISGLAFSGFQPSAQAAEMTVYKDPNCGCCDQWIDHVATAGFTVKAQDTANLGNIKSQLGVPADLQSCHTAIVDGYIVEGHVPAADIKRLLSERPDAIGIAVPGMPLGSPGMEQGNKRESYSVILFRTDGKRSVFAQH